MDMIRTLCLFSILSTSLFAGTITDTSKVTKAFKGPKAFIDNTYGYLHGKSDSSVLADSAKSAPVPDSVRLSYLSDSTKKAPRQDSCRASLIADSAKSAPVPDSVRSAHRSDTLIGKTLDTIYIKALKNDRSTIDSIFAATGRFRDTLHVGGVGNYILFDSSQAQIYYGNRQPYDDMGAVKLHTYKVAGAGVPSLVISPEGWAAYSFDENDSADGSTEEYHSFTEGDTAHYHYHVITGSNDGTTRYVRYRLHWIIKNIGDSLTYNSTASKVDTIPAGTKALTHRIIDLTDIPVPAVKIGAMYILKIHRDTCGLGDPSVNPWILEAGVHRRVNSDGSTGEYIK